MKTSLVEAEFTPDSITQCLVDLLQSALNEKCGAMVEAQYAFKPLPIIDDLQGPIFVIEWDGALKALIRCQHEETVEELALNYCQNTGSPFMVVHAMDFQADPRYKRSPNGRTVTTDLLSIKLLDYDTWMKYRFSIKIKLELPTYESDHLPDREPSDV